MEFGQHGCHEVPTVTSRPVYKSTGIVKDEYFETDEINTMYWKDQPKTVLPSFNESVVMGKLFRNTDEEDCTSKEALQLIGEVVIRNDDLFERLERVRAPPRDWVPGWVVEGEELWFLRVFARTGRTGHWAPCREQQWKKYTKGGNDTCASYTFTKLHEPLSFWLEERVNWNQWIWGFCVVIENRRDSTNWYQK